MKLDYELIDTYLKEKVEFVYTEFSSEVYLVGGAIRSLLMQKIPRDVDIVILCDDDNEIISFIKKYDLEYKKNNFDGYKIYYHDVEIDIWNSNDLYKCVQYNFEGFFYNIKHHLLIPFGFYDAIETRNLKEINGSVLIEKNITDKTKILKRREKLLKSLKEIGDFLE